MLKSTADGKGLFFALVCLVVGVAFADVPSETAGQTLLWRETLSGNVVNPANPGTLTAVDGGELLGRLPNGPTWIENGTPVSWSAAIRNRTEAEGAVGTTVFNGYRDVPAAAAQRGMVSIWIRPTARQPMNPGTFFHLDRSDSSTPLGVPMVRLSNGTFAICASQTVANSLANNGTPNTSLYRVVPSDEWVQLWFVYDPSIGVELWMRQSANDAPDFVGTLLGPGNRTIRAIRLRAVGQAFQGNFAGRVGPVSLYSLSSVAAGRQSPGGFLWPTNAKTVWTVSPNAADHNLQARVIGGFDELSNALRRNVILGRESNAWVDELGNPAGYATVPTAADKRQWWLEWEQGRRFPTGDRVEFLPGLFRGRELPVLNHGGIQYTLTEGAAPYSTEIRMSVPLLAGWSRPDPARPRVWRYDGNLVPKRHVWGRDWQSFQVFFTTAGTDAAITALNGRPWAAYTHSDGTTYISLPDGMSPDQIGPMEGTLPGTLNWSGGWLGKLLIQGSSMYNHTSGSADQAVAGYAIGVTARRAITVLEGRALRCAKHPTALVGNQSEGLVIWYKVDVGFDPPGRAPTDPAGFGVSSGAFTPLVDYTSGAADATNPGRIVTIYDGVTYLEATEPGDGTRIARPPRRSMYYAHGDGTNSKMFALTVVRDPWPFMFSLNPEIPSFPTTPSINHVAFEVLWREDTFQDWIKRSWLTSPGNSVIPTNSTSQILDYALERPLSWPLARIPALEGVNSAFQFSVDTRKRDLRWDVEVSSDLQSWTTVATSLDGGDVWSIPTNQSPFWRIQKSLPNPVAGVRRIFVVRLERTVSSGSPSFFRVRVTRIP